MTTVSPSFSQSPEVPLMIERKVRASDYVGQQSKIIVDLHFQGSTSSLPLYRISDGYILGPHALLAAGDGSIFAESVAYWQHLPEALQAVRMNGFSPSMIGRRSGEYLPLCGIWSNGFWHWMMEFLPLAALAEEGGYRGFYIIPPGDLFIQESLMLLGIDPNRLVVWDGTEWSVDCLVIPPCLTGSDLGGFPGLIALMRRRLAPPEIDDQHFQPQRRIYISRQRSSNGRRIKNEEHLKPVLQKFGFEEQFFEELSLSQQIALAAQSQAIIGPHGAGFTHGFFMKPNSLVIEMFNPHHVNPCMMPIYRFLKTRYYPLSARGPDYLLHEREDFPVSPELVDLILERELGA